MQKMSQAPLVLREGDYIRLMSLCGSTKNQVTSGLSLELARADVVGNAEFPDDVVSMYSHVTYQDVTVGNETSVTIVYPHEADVQSMKVSVLSPIGTALIGVGVGDDVHWHMPNGKIRHLRVIAVEQWQENHVAAVATQ